PVSTFLAVTSALASVLPCKVAPASCAHTMPGPAAVYAIADATNDPIRLQRPLTCFFMCFPSSKSCVAEISVFSRSMSPVRWLTGSPAGRSQATRPSPWRRGRPRPTGCADHELRGHGLGRCRSGLRRLDRRGELLERARSELRHLDAHGGERRGHEARHRNVVDPGERDVRRHAHLRLVEGEEAPERHHVVCREYRIRPFAPRPRQESLRRAIARP